MTTLTTIIEEEKKEFEKKHPMKAIPEAYGITVYNFAIPQNLTDYITSAMQRAYEAGEREADAKWEREVEGMKELHRHNSIPCYTGDEEEGCTTCRKNKTIDTILSKLTHSNNNKI